MKPFLLNTWYMAACGAEAREAFLTRGLLAMPVVMYRKRRRQGYLECGETLEEATARETFEETGQWRLGDFAIRLVRLASAGGASYSCRSYPLRFASSGSGPR